MSPLAAEAFGLDRDQLRNHLQERYGELIGLDAFASSCARTLSERVNDAQEAGAITGPENTAIPTYPYYDSLIICLREQRPPNVNERQLATHAVETKRLVDLGGDGFAECCLAIEAVLDHAARLLPALRSVQAGERDGPPANDAAPDSFNREQIAAALNRSCEDIRAAAELPETGIIDALNLLVNATLARLGRPELELAAVVNENYQESLATVISWIND